MWGGTLIDGTGAPPLPDAVLVVDAAGRLACAGGAGACAEPPDARRVDATGFWIIPGLLDVDVPPPAGEAVDVVERRARLRFLLGVTTERLSYADPTRRAEAAGSVARTEGRPVPRRIVRAPAGLSRLVALDEIPPDAPPGAWAARGVWLEPRLLRRELRVEPYRLSVGLHRLLELPWLVAALRTGSPAGSEPAGGAEGAPADTGRARADLGRARAWVREYHAAGGKVVTGSGGVLAPGLSILAEMRALVTAGLAPEAALAAATREAAAAIGVSDSLGTLVPGKLADFVVLEGDPLADIRNAEIVSRVAKGGVLHDPAGLFEDLKDDLSDRASSRGPRLLLGLLAMLSTLGALAWAVRRHRASLPASRRA